MNDHTIGVISVIKTFLLLCILATSSKYLLLLCAYHFCLYCAHLCVKCSLGISNFLEEISSLSEVSGGWEETRWELILGESSAGLFNSPVCVEGPYIFKEL